MRDEMKCLFWLWQVAYALSDCTHVFCTRPVGMGRTVFHTLVKAMYRNIVEYFSVCAFFVERVHDVNQVVTGVT